jgi:hypothetical protein
MAVRFCLISSQTNFLLPKKRLQRLVNLALLSDDAVHELRLLDVPVGGHQGGVPVVLV